MVNDLPTDVNTLKQIPTFEKKSKIRVKNKHATAKIR